MITRLSILLVALLLSAVPASAQEQLWYVDPVHGADVPQSPPTATAPYKTITHAIAKAQAVASLSSPVTIVCKPGVYSSSTNGEVLPIRPRNFISIRGVGARACLLRGVFTDPAWLSPFLPLWPVGATSPKVILVDFTFLSNTGFTVAFDGFTLQGGEVQVYCSTEEGAKDFRVSNCLFDMVNFGMPEFGALLVQTMDQGVPVRLSAHFLNNTFIQGWRHFELEGYTDLTGDGDSVALCNTMDDNGSLRGEGDLNIQNNLIRCLDDFPRTAMLGIDEEDTTCQIGTPGGPTNAFDGALASQPLSVNGTYFTARKVGKGPPMPKVQIRSGPVGPDPNFLGEQNQAQFLTPDQSSFDARLFPTALPNLNPLQDQGSSPVGGVLRSQANLSFFDVPGTPPAFAWDCDGYGNPRKKGPIDIGFDEIDMLAITGCYGNFSTSYNTPPIGSPGIGHGAQTRYMIFHHQPGATLLLEYHVNLTDYSLSGSLGAYEPPQTLVPGVVIPGFLAPNHTYYMDPSNPLNAIYNLIQAGYTGVIFNNTFDGTPYNYASLVIDPGSSPSEQTGLAFWYKQQMVAVSQDASEFYIEISNMVTEQF